MRLFAEASINFMSLLRIDQEEAISNHDRAFEDKLDAFHRLYDVTKSAPGFDYFAHGDTALLVHLRNALHHRDHTLFVNWHAMMHRDGGVKEKTGAAYLLAKYGGLSEVAAQYFLPLHGFYARLGKCSIKHPHATRARWNPARWCGRSGPQEYFHQGTLGAERSIDDSGFTRLSAQIGLRVDF